MEWSSSKMKYESNCCTSGSIYDPWSSSLCWQTLILAGAGMVLHFFLISGWFALRASRSTTWPCSLSLGDPPDGDAIASNFIFLEPQARHAVLVLHVVRSPPRVFLSETRSCCIWVRFGRERWQGTAGVCWTVICFKTIINNLICTSNESEMQ